jgi:outer membrane receptor protein involved in Fe transport
VVLGASGDIATKGNLRYEVAATWGRTETYYETGGNINVARYNNATDAARDANGNIVCRINLTTVTDPACVPLNPFGYGTYSQAAANYVLATAFRNQWAEQLNATAYISGNTEGFFKLPGGPVGFAVGAEYRREDAYSAFDPLTVSGATFLNAIGAFDPPAQEVRELYGEIRLPLLADVPFFRELTVEGAVRYSDYNTASKGVWAYNGGVVWSPVRDVRFRAAYGRAVRGPNIGDLYATASETFLNGLADPCNQTIINDVPNRARNCAAAGVPTTLIVNGEVRPWTNTPASGISGNNAGNPNLLPETSDSITIGAVFQPRWVPGLSFSVDYYDIKVENVIASLAPQTIINQCYDDPGGINNQYCAAVFRRTSSDPFANATFQGQRDRVIAGLPNINLQQVGPSFLAAPFNYAKLRAKGVDFEMSYVTDLSESVNLSIRAVATYNMQREDFTIVTVPTQSTRLNGVLGLPEWAANLFMTLDFGQFDIGYNAQFLSKQSVSDWEVQGTHQGRGPTNPDANPFRFYPDILYHYLRFGFEPEGTNFRFYGGIDNLLDQLPPLPLTGTGGGSGIYPIQGRYFYAGATVRF